MRRFINPLLLMAAHANRAELIRQIQYLKVENELLRSRLPTRVHVTPQERQRLVRYAKAVGKAVYQLVTIVSPITMRRWLCAARKSSVPRRKPGRPGLPIQTEQLILDIARRTGWGYARILGELYKLGIRNVSRTTVANVLRRNGLDPSKHRKQSTWDEFVQRHAQTLWGCDFMSRRVLTSRGWREAFVLVFINVKSRLAWISPATFKPDEQWSARQAAAFLHAYRDTPNRPEIVQHDHDSRYGKSFTKCIRQHQAQSVYLSIGSPNLNAHAERFIQTLQRECLDHFVVFGCKHLDHLMKEFLIHYHQERPHQGVGNVPLTLLANQRSDPDVIGQIRCRQRLGGLLRHYYRDAA